MIIVRTRSFHFSKVRFGRVPENSMCWKDQYIGKLELIRTEFIWHYAIERTYFGPEKQ